MNFLGGLILGISIGVSAMILIFTGSTPGKAYDSVG